jgi:hypothetical protein
MRKTGTGGAFACLFSRRCIRNACFAVIVLVLLGLAWRGWASSERPRFIEGTRQMSAILAARASDVDPLRLEFAVNDRRAEALSLELQRPQPARKRLSLQFAYSGELLNAGNPMDSLKALESFRADAEREIAPGEWDGVRVEGLMQEALIWLRVAEQENCCARSTPESCILPIRGSGIHEKRNGSTRAIQALTEVLAAQPKHIRARWLLNIAHMTLGSYPQGVPEPYLIPPAVFASEYPLPRYPNVAAECGLDVYAHAGGAVFDDLDNDGQLDLATSSLGLKDQLRIFFGSPDGRFREVTSQAGILGEVGGLNMNHADFDNDGFLDLLVLRGGWMESQGCFPLSLLRNNGDRTFTDVTVQAGLLRFAPTQTAAWLDYDGDGWLDLFVGNESSKNSYPCHLFRNDGKGHFVDVAKSVGVDYVGYVKGVAAGDYDNDGRPDLFLSVLDADNVLFHNDGPAQGTRSEGSWRFTNVASLAGVVEPRASFGCFFFDYDNDGWQDLFVVGYGWTMADGVAADLLGLPTRSERGRLFHNEGGGKFRDVTREAGLYRVIPGMGLNFGDLDNDGYLDFYIGTGNPHLSTLVPNRMFRNDQGRRFQDVTSAGGFGHLQKGHAICFADVDNDGDQDIFAEMGGAYVADMAYSSLYENPGNENGWIQLVLEGTKSNRCAIGARVTVTVDTPTGKKSIYRVVGTGGSFGSTTLRREIGLGAASRIDSVIVTWPSTGRTDRFDRLDLRRVYRITEGNPRAELLSPVRCKLSTNQPRDAER